MSFKREYRMLSFVQRWAIAPRLHHQTVAEHSYFVTLYACDICKILGIKIGAQTLVLEYALKHDAEEAWISDIPGPAKRSIVDPARLDAYRSQFWAEVGGHGVRAFHLVPSTTTESLYRISDIIKVADLIDSLFFLQTELLLGNQMAEGLFFRETQRLKIALQVLMPGASFDWVDKGINPIWKAVQLELQRLGQIGAMIPNNDGDITK